jgi:DNA-binding transcriptional LysR family regulator
MDIKLLPVFDEIYKTRSVSRAGENLGLPQTSVSLARASTAQVSMTALDAR